MQGVFDLLTRSLQEEDAQCTFGLALYSLDRLYKAVERHAKETGEWLRLLVPLSEFTLCNFRKFGDFRTIICFDGVSLAA